MQAQAPDELESMDTDDVEVARLLHDVGQRSLSRRELLCRGIALGLTIPVLGWLLATLERPGSPDA